MKHGGGLPPNNAASAAKRKQTMALEFDITTRNGPVQAQGTVDGIVPFHFEDHGDHWTARIGGHWQHTEPQPTAPGPRRMAEARRNIYRALALFRSQAKRQA
uniref:Uncharacterized protein n=2 Tax=Cereibacter TaxID=1653176 RepID=A4WZX3_CERS5